MTATDPNTELAELAGGFIHELKNHLGTLGLNLQLLAEDLQTPQSPRERRILERVVRLEQECKRLSEMANDFLRFARLGDLNRQPIRLGEIIDEVVDFFGPQARSANIEIKTFIPTDLPTVPLDSQLFKQALLNLMLNAEQAMEKGGQLTFQARQEANQIRLDVIDTGSGMETDDLKKIFKPFYTSRPGGTGLGLPTARRIIERHGGRIEVQSDVGRGTQFTIWLPITTPRSA
ncbi:MAG TPA: ATP-binding protein [Gemmataceae bacterium]|nr:ATP-binding protein [Gemmataceae bacterium]